MDLTHHTALAPEPVDTLGVALDLMHEKTNIILRDADCNIVAVLGISHGQAVHLGSLLLSVGSRALKSQQARSAEHG